MRIITNNGIETLSEEENDRIFNWSTKITVMISITWHLTGN